MPQADTVVIELAGDEAQAEIADLMTWLASDFQVERAEGGGAGDRPEGVPQSLLAAVVLILGTQAAVEAAGKLAESIHVWIKSRRPRVTIRIKEGDREVVVDAENPPDVEALTRQVAALARGGR